MDFRYFKLQNINYNERSRYYIDSNIPFLHVLSGCFNNKTRSARITYKHTI